MIRIRTLSNVCLALGGYHKTEVAIIHMLLQNRHRFLGMPYKKVLILNGL